MTYSELKRFLKENGCTFEERKKHTLALLAGKSTTIPRHPSKEIKAGTLRSILKDLGLTLEKKKE